MQNEFLSQTRKKQIRRRPLALLSRHATTLDDKIFFGFSADYPDHYSPGRTQPTIAFFGSPDMFAKFASWLEERSDRTGGSERLNDAPFFSHANVDVLLPFVTRSRGMNQVDKHTLEWSLAPREIETFSLQLQGLAKSPPAETRWVFLDCPDGAGVDVVAQVGEDEHPRSAFT